MEGHVYHWKHGWIPLDHLAARIKAKGSTSGMHRYVSQYHIPDRRAGGSDRREAGKALHGVEKRGTADSSVKRGGFEYRRGTATRNYPQRGEVAPAGGPKSAAEAFKMKRAELEPHARAGNPHAQAELERRAAKHGKVPAPRPEPKAPAPAPRAPEPKPVPAPRAPEPEAPKAPEAGDWMDTAHGRSRVAAETFGHGSPQHRAFLNAEDKEIENALNGSKTVGHIGPHRILGSPTGNAEHGGIFSTHHVAGKFRAVGQVSRSPLAGPDAPFKAEHLTYTAKGNAHSPIPLGTFKTRQEAHHAIAVAEAAHQAKTDASVARKAERQAQGNATRAEASARIVKAARGINGAKWEPVEVQPGERVGNTVSAFHGKVAGNVKYAFQSGNKRVVIEAPMAEHEVTGLLNDTADVLERAGANAHHIPVIVRVPSRDGHFTWKDNGGNVGGYVHRGGTVIHVNPVLARGEAKGDSFGHQHGGTHFMPANAGVHARAYVLTHELGHVVDGQNGHTASTNPFESASRDASAFHQEHRSHGRFGRYGGKNPAEGYAEAFAQHQLGGPGSHPAADNYAARYGWHAPATTYSDPTGKAQAAEARRSEFQAAWDRGVAKGLSDAQSTGARLSDATTRKG